MKIRNLKQKNNLLNIGRNKVSIALACVAVLPMGVGAETTKSDVDVQNAEALSQSGEINKGRVDEILEGETIPNVIANNNERSHSLDLMLKNEYRNADRPSASGDYGPKIDAWVQYFGFDYKTENLLPWVDVQAGVHSTARIHSNLNKSSRFYLDGHDDFTLFTGSIDLKPTENIELQIGRFGTDYYAGSLDYFVPLLDESSVRPTPSYKEGALLKAQLGNFHWYAAAASRYAGGYYQDWQDYGVVTDVDYVTGEVEVDEDYKYFLSTVWDNNDETGTQVGVGLSFMKDHSYQALINPRQIYIDSNGAFWKAEAIGYYGKLIGRSRDFNSNYLGMMGLQDKEDTGAISGQLTYSKDGITVIGSAGQVGTKLNPLSLIDTDVGYSFDQSIDRNHEDMFSWQLGGFYQVSDNLNAGLAMVITSGHEDSSKQVEVEGTGANLIVSHKGYGSLQGLDTMLILNKAVEYREGSRLGDKLDYYDIKLTFHYPLNLF